VFSVPTGPSPLRFRNLFWFQGTVEGSGLYPPTHTTGKVCTPLRDRPVTQKTLRGGVFLRFDSENSWISEGLPSSSRRRRRGEGRREGGGGREKVNASEVDVGVDGAKSDQSRETAWLLINRRRFLRDCHRNHRRRYRRHCHQSSQRSRVHQHVRLQRRHSRVH